MYFRKKKNIKQRLLFKEMEKKKKIFKSISQNLKINKYIRWQIEIKQSNYCQNNSITRIKNICLYSNRSKSVYRFVKMSRIVFRIFASNKKIPGIFKYSW